MKVLLLISCVAAVASAGYLPAPVGYHGPQHVPVIHNGVPVETPEVQHARAAHFAALQEAASRPGYQSHAEPQGYDSGAYAEPAHYAPAPVHYSAPAPVHYSAPAPAPVHYAPVSAPAHFAPAQYSGKGVPHAYQTSHVLPAVDHSGRPLDTPEVEQAKAHHFAAFSEALARAPKGPAGPYQAHYRKRRGLYSYHVPVINHHGVPVDEPAVQHARAAHLAAHAASSHYGYNVHQNHAPVYGLHSSKDYNFYGVDHKGRPLDTPEVAHAKAAHFAAFHEAAARNSIHPVASHGGAGYATHYGYGAVAPVETPEVQHAKALHFAAHAAAKGHGHY